MKLSDVSVATIMGLAIVVLTVIATAQPACAVTDEIAGDMYEVQDGVFLFTTPTWMAVAPAAYYKVYGEWPEAWSAIVNAGLFQVPLKGAMGETIDPDDESFDFNGDMAYHYRGPQTKPLIQNAGTRGGLTVHAEEVTDAPYSYADYLTDFGYDEDVYGPLIEQPDRLKMCALQRMLLGAVGWFSRTHGRVPLTWNELITSGLTPIDEHSVNPITGGPFYGDGRANNFLYESDGEHWYNIQVTDENGDTPWRVDY